MPQSSLFSRILKRFAHRSVSATDAQCNTVDVCVIDAARSDCDLARLILESRGICCAVARDGDNGLALIRALRPRLTVVDLPLPGRNGYDVIAELRRDPELDGLKILLCTALTKADPEPSRDWAKLSGADDFLIKPYDPADFLGKVTALLETRGPA